MVGMTIITQIANPFRDVGFIHEGYTFVHCVGRRWYDGSWSVLEGYSTLYAGYRPLFNFGDEDV